MSTMNISLPDSLKSFVDEQVIRCGYGTVSEYVRELIRTDQDRRRLRGLLLAGAASAPAEPADTAYFDALGLCIRRFKTTSRSVPQWPVDARSTVSFGRLLLGQQRPRTTRGYAIMAIELARTGIQESPCFALCPLPKPKISCHA